MEFENQRPAQSMVRLFMAYIPSMVIFAAARLELTDHIGDDGASAPDLAQKLEVDPGALAQRTEAIGHKLLPVMQRDLHQRLHS